MIFFHLFFLQTEAKPPGKAFLCRTDVFFRTGLPPEMKQQELFHEATQATVVESTFTGQAY